MRLKSIKLNGFKSFVDATSVRLPSNLVAVCGPNGCGKSNIIDAVRWVMGESSVKYLRGESMSDVIFNGSSTRPPLAKASIELVFDNEDGGLGGEYAKYSEISIRREVVREGQSVYYLNNARCRRRDITDIFLGTGLGPRSYAIIQQGTVSRLIEAKPEELRHYLEEAAGISKYKERRRETQNRIKHTRENLERLLDIREELDKQLNHLDRQSQAAQKYQQLKQEERLLTAQSLALRWQQYDSEYQEESSVIGRKEVELESYKAKQLAIESDIEKHRALQNDLQEELNTVQGEFYAVGAEIARLEQTLQHQRERKDQLQHDFAQTQASHTEAEQNCQQDDKQFAIAQAELKQIEPELLTHQEIAEESAERLLMGEETASRLQHEWDAFNKSAAEASQKAQVEQTRIQHLEERILNNSQRMKRFDDEIKNLAYQDLEQEMAVFTEQIVEQEAVKEQLSQSLLDNAAEIEKRRSDNQALTQQLNGLQNELQTLSGTQASLQTLQNEVLGKSNDKLISWLTAKGLDQHKRLAQELEVEAGWETAVETVLGDYLQAICLQDFTTVAGELDTDAIGGVSFFASGVATESSHNLTDKLLLTKVKANVSLIDVLSGVYFAETLSDALQLRGRLNSGESVVTRDGVWLSGQWLRVKAGDTSSSGVIQREEQIKQLAVKMDEMNKQIDDANEAHGLGSERLSALESDREDLQQQLSAIAAKIADLGAQAKVKQDRIGQLERRQAQLQKEYAELNTYLQQDEEKLKQARLIWQEAMECMESDAGKREELISAREDNKQLLEDLRIKAREDRDVAHHLKVRNESLQTQVNSLTETLARARKQLDVLAQRKETIEQNIQESEAPVADFQLAHEDALEQRVQTEERLTLMRQKTAEQNQLLQDQESARHKLEQDVNLIRSELEQHRLNWQGLKVNCGNIVEQLTEAEQDLHQVIEQMPADANLATWTAELERIERRIQRLGPINLAAIEEYKTAAERKTYLDEQNQDLEEAMATLENAIRKIDRETRSRFKETFDKVQNSFQELFPKLFGGGSASLELTEDDLLEAGVTVMARPPGKRNSTIHLLSGGEKALTAVALVFAIFKLNPAPFCMLDEVDAPLDDANVGRFCQLVSEMSKTLQFIYISHNKPTMAMADHLVGITMNEPGVSRVVAVDMEEAVTMAEV